MFTVENVKLQKGSLLMFRRKVKPISEVISKFLREGGLESPLLQKRIITAWDIVVGPTITRYTQEKGIRNQTLFVKISILPCVRTFL